jgi:two-component system, chemotaxis family, chemotaxis protein CheY
VARPKIVECPDFAPRMSDFRTRIALLRRGGACRRFTSAASASMELLAGRAAARVVIGRGRTKAEIEGSLKLVAIKALIIDDSPIARKIIRHHLGQIGCRVVAEAANGAQGLKLFRELKPQLVTLDLIMPLIDGMDGVATFRAMRQEDPGAAILVVSAVPFEKTRESMVDEGALGYIIKPFTRFSFEQVRPRLLRAFPELSHR